MNQIGGVGILLAIILSITMFDTLYFDILLENQNFVLSLGGGTPCYYDNMELVNAKAVSIFLDRSIPDLFHTLKEQRVDRPLIAHLAEADLKEFIAKHLFERRSFYEQAIFKTKPSTPQDQLLDEIKSFIS